MQQLKNALEEVGHCLAQFHFRLLVRLGLPVGWLSMSMIWVSKKFPVFWNVVGISQNSLYNHLEGWTNFFCKFLRWFSKPQVKKKSLGTNVVTRVIPRFSIAASKRVKTVEVSKRNPAILIRLIPLILEVMAMNNMGTSNHPTSTMKRGQMSWLSLMPQTQDFFFVATHTKNAKMWRG